MYQYSSAVCSLYVYSKRQFNKVNYAAMVKTKGRIVLFEYSKYFYTSRQAKWMYWKLSRPLMD